MTPDPGPGRYADTIPDAAAGTARLYGAIAIGYNVVLSALTIARLATLDQAALRPALLAVAVTVPLHIRHVIFGLRGSAPPAGVWTLLALVIVNAIAAAAAGVGWLFEFASLAVSILIVVRGPWAFALAGLVILSPLVLTPILSYYNEPPALLPAPYLALALLWRTIAQIIPVRLVAVLSRATAARQELETRAVIQDRVRIDEELRSGLGGSLRRVVGRGEQVLRALPADAGGAASELRDLLEDSRRALAEARKIAAHYRVSSVRAELGAAAALLRATGATVRVDVDADAFLAEMDAGSRAVLRAALMRALEEAAPDYRVTVSRTPAGTLGIDVQGLPTHV